MLEVLFGLQVFNVLDGRGDQTVNLLGGVNESAEFELMADLLSGINQLRIGRIAQQVAGIACQPLGGGRIARDGSDEFGLEPGHPRDRARRSSVFVAMTFR